MPGRYDIIDRHSAAQKDAFNKTFAELPQKIRAASGDMNSVSPVNLWLQLLQFGDKRNCNFWIAVSKDNHEALARIGADIPAQRPSEGSIGFFDCVDSAEGHDAGRELIQRAMDWLSQRGAAEVFAPLDFNSWFNYRFKIRETDSAEGSDKVWEPTAPSFHRALFFDRGFSDHLFFASHSYEVPTRQHWNAYLQMLKHGYDSIIQKGYRLRAIATGGELIGDLKNIFDLSNIAFADNPMFEEIPFEIFAGLTMALAQRSNMEASRICISPQDEVIGFAFCFTEENHLVYKTVAVHPDHRSLGIANAFTYEISDYCVKNGIFKTTGALIRAGNTSEKIGQKHGQIAQPADVNRYVLMKRSLK